MNRHQEASKHNAMACFAQAVSKLSVGAHHLRQSGNPSAADVALDLMAQVEALMAAFKSEA